jgi:hypothetical protein
MRHVLLAQAEAKNADDISGDNEPVSEVKELMMIAGEGEEAVNDDPPP